MGSLPTGDPMMMRVALLAAIMLCAVRADEATSLSESDETDCEKMVCKDTMFGDMKCKDGWLATESNETDVSQRKCECINPCYGKQCTPPYLAVIDYTRQTDGNCKCVWPGDLHVPLNANATTESDDECGKMVCDTKFGFLKYKPEKVNEECKCVAHYTEGPCKDQVCPDGYLVLESKDGKCGCSNPCV